MSEDNEKTQTFHDETASEQQQLIEKALAIPVPGASGGTKGSGTATDGDGGFEEARQFIQETNDAIDLTFDTLEVELYKARIRAKQAFIDRVFPPAQRARSLRQRKANQPK